VVIHPEEVRLARLHQSQTPFQSLTSDQIHQIMVRGRELHRWFKGHHGLHCLINAALLVFLFVVDYVALLRLPGIWLVPGGENALAAQIEAATAVHGAQPHATGQLERVPKLRIRVLGHADWRRTVGNAVPLGTSSGGEHSLVPATDASPLRRRPADASTAPAVPAAARDRVSATSLVRECSSLLAASRSGTERMNHLLNH
jgi:hypothetical protein